MSVRGTPVTVRVQFGGRGGKSLHLAGREVRIEPNGTNSSTGRRARRPRAGALGEPRGERRGRAAGQAWSSSRSRLRILVRPEFPRPAAVVGAPFRARRRAACKRNQPHRLRAHHRPGRRRAVLHFALSTRRRPASNQRQKADAAGSPRRCVSGAAPRPRSSASSQTAGQFPVAMGGRGGPTPPCRSSLRPPPARPERLAEARASGHAARRRPVRPRPPRAAPARLDDHADDSLERTRASADPRRGPEGREQTTAKTPRVEPVDPLPQSARSGAAV